MIARSWLVLKLILLLEIHLLSISHSAPDCIIFDMVKAKKTKEKIVKQKSFIAAALALVMVALAVGVAGAQTREPLVPQKAREK